MASPTVTFPCPFCGRRMGVPAELLGRQVRCPHCKQVVLAPATAGGQPTAPPQAATAPQAPPPAPTPVIQIASPPPPPPPAPKPAAVSSPPPPPPESDLPVFKIPQRKEGADSILSEDESEDEVFGSQVGGRLRILQPLDPTEPVSQPSPKTPAQSEPSATRPTDLAPTSVMSITPVPPNAQSSPSPITELEPTNSPNAVQPAPKPTATSQAAPAPAHPVAAPQPQAPLPARPVAAPAPQPVEPAQASVAANPFADFDTPPAASTSAPVAPRPSPKSETPDEDGLHKRKKRDREERDDRDAREEPKEKPSRPGYSRDGAKSRGGVLTLILLIVVGVYALIATAAATYGLFFKTSEKLDTGHPLSTIPDNFGEFEPATRKKVTQYRFPVDGDLPTAQRGALGDTITVGQVEVQPLKIEKRRLELIKEGTDGKTTVREWSPVPALVLTMTIKNNSDVNIYPMDPAFTRRSSGSSDKPITRLVVDRQTTFSGGAIIWPWSGPFKRHMEVQQTNDYVPLTPGMSREYVVFTDARNDIIKAVEAASGPLQWRVQVRRDPVTYRGKEIPVTAIIGVDFRSSDVH